MTDETKKEDTEDQTATVTDEPEGDAAPENDAGQKDPVRRWVLIFTVIAAALLVWYLAADRLTPFSSQGRVNVFVVAVAPEVSGTVESVAVTNNQFVESGQELLRIDHERYELALASARSNLELARDQQAAKAAVVESARAGLEAAKANLLKSQQDAERLQRIYDEDPGAISVRLLESSRANYTASQAQVAAAEADLERATRDLGEPGDDNPNIVAAKSALDSAQLDFDRTLVRAPDSGLVTDVKVDTGNYAAAGQPLMTFVAIHTVWVQADMTENNISHIDPGDEVEIVFDVQPGKIVKGRVRSVGYGVQAEESTSTPGQLPTIQNERSWLRDAQRFPVLIDIDSGESLGEIGLRAGGRADVIVFTDRRPILNTLGRLYIRIKGLLSYAY